MLESRTPNHRIGYLLSSNRVRSSTSNVELILEFPGDEVVGTGQPAQVQRHECRHHADVFAVNPKAITACRRPPMIREKLELPRETFDWLRESKLSARLPGSQFCFSVGRMAGDDQHPHQFLLSPTGANVSGYTRTPEKQEQKQPLRRFRKWSRKS